jgi:CHAT domain-containing protein
VLRALVDNYLEQISDPAFRLTRGMRLEPRPAARPLPAQRPEFLAQILLPAAARQRIKALAPESLIVVPDGALHKLPFEALVLRAGDRPAYVLDELPPLIYAPSVAILDLLASRPPAAPKGPRSLLTVADPDYSRGEKRETRDGKRQGPSGRAARVGMWGRIPRLRGAREESRRISQFFGDQVVALHGPNATERALVAALAGRHVVHIAAHGIADEDQDSQFWALVLTPPGGPVVMPEDDGFLELHEIYTLPLSGCELAVLSACLTNVGPHRPLEAGVTLAGGFLAAGARRVVASHWAVDDESTAELMEAFFQQVTADAKAGRPVAYARALQRARRQVRGRADWSAPYFWAPFVLIGPAD